MQTERMRVGEDGKRRIRKLRQCWQLTREIGRRALATGLNPADFYPPHSTMREATRPAFTRGTCTEWMNKQGS